MTKGYLLDTVTVSEWMKPRPDPGVVSWFRTVDEDRAHLSVITIGELRRGVERLPAGRRQSQLAGWLGEELPDRFAGRLLPVGIAIADEWGRITARSARQGRPVGAIDALIAATAAHHDLLVITRNVYDFEPTGVAAANPWTGQLHRDL